MLGGNKANDRPWRKKDEPKNPKLHSVQDQTKDRAPQFPLAIPFGPHTPWNDPLECLMTPKLGSELPAETLKSETDFGLLPGPTNAKPDGIPVQAIHSLPLYWLRWTDATPVRHSTFGPNPSVIFFDPLA